MFNFLLSFVQIGNVVGEVFGVLGTAMAIGEIFLYVEDIKSSGGEKVTQESVAMGNITLKDIQFTYPSKDI